MRKLTDEGCSPRAMFTKSERGSGSGSLVDYLLTSIRLTSAEPPQPSPSRAFRWRGAHVARPRSRRTRPPARHIRLARPPHQALDGSGTCCWGQPNSHSPRGSLPLLLVPQLPRGAQQLLALWMVRHLLRAPRVFDGMIRPREILFYRMWFARRRCTKLW